jgi:hypothetical protein
MFTLQKDSCMKLKIHHICKTLTYDLRMVPLPPAECPHPGSNVTELMQSLINCVANHAVAEGDPIIQHFDDFDNMLNTGDILMVFAMKNLGLPPQG